MEAAELARHRQEYLDEMERFCKGIWFDYPTEKGFEYLMSLIPDKDIIYNVEHGIQPVRTIEELVYYNIVCFG